MEKNLGDGSPERVILNQKEEGVTGCGENSTPFNVGVSGL